MISQRARGAVVSVCVAVLFVGIRSAAAQSAAIEGRIVDEPRSHSVIDTADPFAPVEFGPSAAAARHRASISAIAPVGWGVQVAPIFYYRSALPVSLIEGLDRNNDFNNNELPDRACGGRSASSRLSNSTPQNDYLLFEAVHTQSEGVS